MSDLKQSFRKALRPVLTCTIAGLILTTGLTVPAGAQRASVLQQTTATPSPAQLRAFESCLGNSVDQEGRNQCGDPIYDDCNQKSGMPDTTIAMSECLMVVHAAWDRSLNRVYQATMLSEPPSVRTMIRTAQRIWITGRKADCDAVYEANIGGSIRTIVYASCMVNATRQRYNWLASFGE